MKFELYTIFLEIKNMKKQTIVLKHLKDNCTMRHETERESVHALVKGREGRGHCTVH